MKFIPVNALLLAWIVVGFTQHANGQLKIEFQRPMVEVTDTTVRLGDIALVSAATEKQAEAARAVDLDTFEGDNREISISREQVRIRMILAGFRASDLDLTGPERIVASLRSSSATDLPLEDLLKRQLSEQYSIPEIDLQLRIDSTFKRNGQQIVWPSVRLESLGTPEIPLGQQKLMVQAKTRFDEIRSIKIPVTISIFRELAVAKTEIPRGTPLTTDNVESVRRPVSSRAVGYSSLTNALGKIAQNDIERYELIKPKSLRAEVRDQWTLKRNTHVTLVVRSGKLVARIPRAKAMTDGNVGDRIEVINPINRERMVAQVVDAFTVEIR